MLPLLPVAVGGDVGETQHVLRVEGCPLNPDTQVKRSLQVDELPTHAWMYSTGFQSVAYTAAAYALQDACAWLGQKEWQQNSNFVRILRGQLSLCTDSVASYAAWA